MNFLQKILAGWRSRPHPKPRVRIPPPAPAPPAPPVILNKLVHYVLNDPSTPELLKDITPPVATTPPYIVKDYVGGGEPISTKGGHSANCFVTITNALDYYRRMTSKPLTKWAGTSVLRVFPQAGPDLNAYYDRASLRFFYYGRPEIGGMVFTADSSDVVAHELGHAILDAYRPETFNAASLEVWSFHEAWADLTAVMAILTHEEIIQHVLKQTGGNLRTSNVASNLAEQVGRAIYILTKDQARNPNCLRSALNDFCYVNPGSLPKEAPNNQLAAEPHSFGRVFLGALYELFITIYEDLSTKMPAAQAIAQARDGITQRMLATIQNAPVNIRFYESVAKTLLWVENTMFSNVYHDKFLAVLQKRKILGTAVKMLGVSKCEDENRIVKMQSIIRVKLGDHLIRAQADNPLYDAEVEIPHEQAHLYDHDKNLMDTILVSEEESLSGAQTMIEYLHNAKQVSYSPDTPFSVLNGRLIRTHFS